MFRILAWLRRRLPKHWTRRRFAAVSVLLVFLLSRGVLFATAQVGYHFALPRYHGDWDVRPGDLYVGDPPPKLLLPLVRWDALYYTAIAREGYPPAREGPVFHIAFFPLYPLLVREVSTWIPDTFVAAVLISNLASLLAALLLSSLGGARKREGLIAAMWLLLSPGAHFLGLPYTEGLFSLLLVGALVCIARNRPWAAAALGSLASATRSAGVVVFGALVLDAWDKRRSLGAMVSRLLAAVGALGGLVAFAAFCSERYGDPLAFSHVMGRWNRHISLWGPIQALFAFNVDPDTYLVVVVAAVALAVGYRKFGLRAALLPAFLILLPTSTGLLKGFIRYQSTNSPLMLLSGKWLRGRLLDVSLAASIALLLYETFRYAAGYANY